MRHVAHAFILALAVAGQAHGATPPGWLDSPAAATFRQRVVDLAVLYEESSGIDPQGLRVVARRTGELPGGCFAVEVRTFEAEQQARRDDVVACKRPAH